MYSEVLTQRVQGMSIERQTGHIYDLSEGGARIELDHPIEVGEGLAVNLRLAGGCTISAQADVVRLYDDCDDPGPRRMGIEFKQFLSDRDHQSLLDYLKHEAPRRVA